MCACVYARLNVCLSVECLFVSGMFVCLYVCMHMHVCMYVCMHVCMYVCMCVCILNVCMHVHLYVHVYVRMFVCNCMFVCMYASMNNCLYVCMRAQTAGPKQPASTQKSECVRDVCLLNATLCYAPEIENMAQQGLDTSCSIFWN